MTEMHTLLMDTIGLKDQLQRVVDSFDQDNSLYEETLSRIVTLEGELRDAHCPITSLLTSNKLYTILFLIFLYGVPRLKT